MEKKIYKKPLIQVINLDSNDIIATSSFGNEYDSQFDMWKLGEDDHFWD